MAYDETRSYLAPKPERPAVFITELEKQLHDDNQEIMRINNSLREAMLAIKALCAGDKNPNWKDDWTTTATRGRIMDIIDTTVR